MRVISSEFRARLVHIYDMIAKEGRSVTLPLSGRNEDPLELKKRPFVVCGEQRWAYIIVQTLCNNDVNVVGFCDQDLAADNPHYVIPCFTPDELPELISKNPELIVVNLNGFNNQWTSVLGVEFGIPVLTFAHVSRIPGMLSADGSDEYMDAIVEDFEGFLAVEKHIKDEWSLCVLYSILLYKLTSDCSYLCNVSQPYNTVYFFNGLFDFHEKEVFLDCGAFTGDTLAAFIAITSGKFEHAYSFEPEEETFEKLLATVRRFESSGIPERVTCLRKGLWSSSGQLNFQSSGGGGL